MSLQHGKIQFVIPHDGQQNVLGRQRSKIGFSSWLGLIQLQKVCSYHAVFLWSDRYLHAMQSGVFFDLNCSKTKYNNVNTIINVVIKYIIS